MNFFLTSCKIIKSNETQLVFFCRGGFTGSFRSGGRFGSSQGGARGRGGHFRGGSGGRGRGRGRGDPVSSEDLDADLEKYHSEAMQIN